LSSVDWAVVGHPLKGQSESGDLHVVAPFVGGVLIAAIDGLGHGPEAAVAARAASVVLTSQPTASLHRLIELCHEALRNTRGAVITLASFDTRRDELTWMGVGNAEGVLLHADASSSAAAPLRGGVVGFRLPAFREATVPVVDGDTLVLATDGIRSGFSRVRSLLGSPGELAEAIMLEFRKPDDDAMVVVARYTEGSA
jgi:phosphoserine phosphatase RsbX